MKIHVITYATHSFGLYNELIENNRDIITIGWGKKWNGFTDKLIYINKYLHNYIDDKDIVVIVDGFDTKIIKDLETVKRRFLQFNCKVLLSKDYNGTNPFIKYLKKKVFKECHKNITINSGLFMGYARELKLVFNHILNKEKKCKDDQRLLNVACSSFNFIEIDEKNEVFENFFLHSDTKNLRSNACILGFPGLIHINRCHRALREYAQFFIFELLLIFILLFIVFNNNNIIKTILFCALIYIISISDTSCIRNH